MSLDVIVIGAGIAGVSAAAEIAADANVVVVEMETSPGYHATGRSAAYFAPAYGNAVVRNVTAASEQFFRNPAHGFTTVPLIRNRDAIFVGREDQAAQIAAMLSDNDALVPVDRAYLKQRIPILSDVIVAGLRDPIGGDLDVDALLQGYLRLLKQRGGEVKASHNVSSIDRVGDLWQVRSGNESLEAPYLLNAAGAWADKVAGMAGLDALGLVPKRRTATLIDPPADIETQDWPLVVDVEEGFYFKPDAGQLLVSPADETPSEPCDAQPDELDIAVAIDRFMGATTMQVRRVNHRWAGLRTFAPDNTFVVGLDPRTNGFCWLAGQGGYGVQSAPGMAQLARHLLLKTPLPTTFARLAESIAAVSPARLIK